MENNTVTVIDNNEKTLKQTAGEIYNIERQLNYYRLYAQGFFSYTISPYLEKIRRLYDEGIDFFTKEEELQESHILNILKSGTFPYVLLTGKPASGKSVFAYKIAKDIEQNPNDFKVYYYTCRDDLTSSDLIDDIKFYNKMDENMHKKLYILDDIHLSPNKMFHFFTRVKSENMNCAFLFISRAINSDGNGESKFEDIYRELKKVTFQIEFSVFKSNDVKMNRTVRRKKASVQEEKIKGIIQTFAQKNNLSFSLSDAFISKLIDITGFDLLNLYYFLKTWKEESENNINLELHMIDERAVMKHIYFNNLFDSSPKEREVIIKYACIYQYETWFEVKIEDYDIISRLIHDGIIVKDEKTYSFYHSKFAELLIKAYLEFDDFFDMRYKDETDLVISRVHEYIFDFSSNRYRKYPLNTFELFNGIIGAKNFGVHSRKNEINTNIFRTLIADNDIRNIVIDFFASSSINSYKIKRFLDLVNNNANIFFDDFYNALVLKDNYLFLKNKILNDLNSDVFLAFVLFVNEYMDFFYVFTENEIKTIMFKSKFNALKYLYFLKDVNIIDKIKTYFDIKEWFSLLKDSGIDNIRDVLTFINNYDKEFAVLLLKQFSDTTLADKIKENFIIGFAYATPIINELDAERLRIILDSFEIDYIALTINTYLKNNTEETNIPVVSDFLQSINKIDKDKTRNILSRIDFDVIYSYLKRYNLSQILSFFSKMKEVDNEKVRCIFKYVDFELIKDKILYEPANNILNTISEIKYLDENLARELIYLSKEKLIETLPEIPLSTFISYEKRGLIVIEAEVTAEIMGKIPDEYIRGFYDLSDMRDLIRLISLYRHIDFSVFNKKYILDEIFCYIEKNFTQKFLHKKWIASTMNLLDVCSIFGKKIESVEKDESKKILKSILLAKGNLHYFSKNIMILRKHSENLAYELELELGYEINEINNQMKGKGIFMKTILITVLKFLGASIGSGITWDYIKSDSSSIVEHFVKKFVEEKYFDDSAKCEEFFYKICVNDSYNDEEPFDDVKTLYKKYAKGKPYDVFEAAFKEWLTEDLVRMLSQGNKSMVSMFDKANVEQKAENIYNIGVQNNWK